MNKHIINKIKTNGVYLYGVDKKVKVVSGVDLFGERYFIVTTKGFEDEPILYEADYGLLFSLKPF